MFASLLTVALAASSAAAVPLQARKEAPNGWSAGKLEDYNTYHTRYIALDCQNKHGQDFFDACCHPLKNGDDVEEFYSSNDGQCRPADGSMASASARIAANAAKTASPVPSATSASASASAVTSDAVQPGDDAGAEYFDAGASSSTAAPSSTSTEAPKPSPTEEPKQDENKDQGNQGGNVLKSFTGGKATHFTPWDGTGKSFSEDPQPGNCGYNWGDYGGLQGNWVALKTGLYNSGEYCGKQVKLTSKMNGATVYATVLDSCPSCSNEAHIDVSPNVFNQLQNVVKINFDNDDQPSNDPGEVEVDWEILG